MANDFSLVIVGVGGQGVLVAAQVIGEAAIDQGFDCMQSEVHGMAQRGGVVTSMIKIGEDVGSPLIPKGGADMIFSTEPIEAYRALPYLKKDGIIVTNTEPIYPFTVNLGDQKYPPMDEVMEKLRTWASKVYTIEGGKIAKELGNKKAMNIVVLGLAVGSGKTPLSKEYVLGSVKRNVPKKFIDLNVNAFEQGFDKGEQ